MIAEPVSFTTLPTPSNLSYSGCKYSRSGATAISPHFLTRPRDFLFSQFGIEPPHPSCPCERGDLNFSPHLSPFLPPDHGAGHVMYERTLCALGRPRPGFRAPFFASLGNLHLPLACMHARYCVFEPSPPLHRCCGPHHLQPASILTVLKDAAGRNCGQDIRPKGPSRKSFRRQETAGPLVQNMEQTPFLSSIGCRDELLLSPNRTKVIL